jgi:hypothetical protein
MTSGLAELRVKVATACRVLARQGLIDGILGHVSVRVDRNQLLVRCRGPRERGLLFTTLEEIRLLDFAGEGDLGDAGCDGRPPGVPAARPRPDHGGADRGAGSAARNQCRRTRSLVAGGRPLRRQAAGHPVVDLAELPDLGSGFNDRFLWQFHQARLRPEGLGL